MWLITEDIFYKEAATIDSLASAMALSLAAVLCKTVDSKDIASEILRGEAAKKLMRKISNEREALGLAKVSLVISCYMFWAVAKAEIYEEVWKELLGAWRNMLGRDLTTWVKKGSIVKSDCHGWNATPMYETVGEIFGIKYPVTKNNEGY
ncbi:hypothetical protein OCU04_002228 [Sclerotinia nivalis]|uniref:Uncharacterized protein n=1 Tax=Sclerotinia nivalis TaxID=352851 RepID=A0A9X0B143_9HELO|nr:hypothetical protein OCU04_002228 [Sclerotinia nivalis]